MTFCLFRNYLLIYLFLALQHSLYSLFVSWESHSNIRSCRSDMGSNVTEIKQSISFLSWPFFSILEEYDLISPISKTGDVAVTGEHFANIEIHKTLYWLTKNQRFCGLIRGIDSFFVNQVAGIQKLFLRFIKAILARRVTRSVRHLNHPIIQVKN